MNAIETHDIVKSFGNVNALTDINISVSPGEIYGLLGPDGAGKTTLFRILTTLMLPDSGSAEVCGFDVIKQFNRIRSISGYMPGRFSLYPDLSVEENLNFYAALFGGKATDNFDIIAPIYNQLAPFKNRRASNLSGGMKQKLALCCALVHKPKILFLDEPTTGVDAVSRSEFWDILGEIKKSGMPILVSTPYMDEASRCDRISLINSGKILETGTLNEILTRNAIPVLAMRGKDNYRTLLDVRKVTGVKEAFLFGEYIHVFIDAGFDMKRLSTLPGIEDIKTIGLNIEDVFIKIMSNGERKSNHS